MESQVNTATEVTLRQSLTRLVDRLEGHLATLTSTHMKIHPGMNAPVPPSQPASAATATPPPSIGESTNAAHILMNNIETVANETAEKL